MRRHELIQFDVLDIHVGDRQRAVTDERVAALAASIKEIGLQTPISVRIVPEVTIDGEIVREVPVLIAGAHRLAAVKSLGHERIDCFLVGADDLEARLWEFDENLARAELTPSEIAQIMPEREKIWKEIQARNNGQTLATNRGRGRPREFAAETAAATGRAKSGINQALARGEKIAPDVLEAVKGTALDKGVHLDALAKKSHAEQRKTVADVAAGKPVSARPAINDYESTERQVDALMRAWNAAGPEAREEFLARVDQPVFDRANAGKAA